jgi:hypothetical protein
MVTLYGERLMIEYLIKSSVKTIRLSILFSTCRGVV